MNSWGKNTWLLKSFKADLQISFRVKDTSTCVEPVWAGSRGSAGASGCYKGRAIQMQELDLV